MEPPIGYGLTHRSIFPESQFGTVTRSIFQGPVTGSRLAALRAVLARLSQGPYDRSLSNHGLGKGHHGAQVSVGLRSYGRVGRDNGVFRTLDCASSARTRDAEPATGPLSSSDDRVGLRAGVNLPLYGPAVTHVFGLDPSPELLRLASKRAREAVVPVSLLRGSAEQVPFADAVFDAIVMTWTLCSIPNPIAALTEMRRVLKPGGQLLFVEHGLSPEIRTARWQHRLTPYWKRISGGCHLDRKTDDLIRAAGFQIDAIEMAYMQGPKPWTFMYQGSAKNVRAALSG
jgi:SAM-dependent methyltransferase